MKISASMLNHQLQKYFNVEYSSIKNANYAKTLIFYNTFFDMDSHIIITDSHSVVQCVGRVNNAIIVCLNRIEEIPDLGTNDLIVLDDTMSDTMAFNILTHILDYYNEWEINLTDIVYNHHDFQALIDSINEVIELPVALFDSEYRYIAFSKDSTTEKYIKFVDRDNHIPIEQVNNLHNIPEYESLENKKQAFYVDTGEPTIYHNIFQGGSYVARLAVMFRLDIDDVDYCKSIFNTVAPYVETLYDMSSNYAYTSAEYRHMHQYMDAIVHNKVVERESFVDLLTRLHCEDDDIWRTYSLHLFKPDQFLYSASYTCYQIENRFPGCFCINTKESIMCLTNLSLYERSVGPGFDLAFAKYQKDSMHVGGVSRDFKNAPQFENIFFSKVQAEYAYDSAPQLQLGVLADFKDYALDYLLRYGTNGLSAQNICHPAILTLMEHDRKHSTSFTNTLYLYMQNNMNAMATAKKLFIHRSSFNNRMERIHSLVDIDFNNPDEVLYLGVSFNRFYNP
ncbi:MAG: hypothetical protein E7241_01970 [Lachnospiraceae bacterium]|nr:hypothetical protein [Lachnospiraceae bacterium]